MTGNRSIFLLFLILALLAMGAFGAYDLFVPPFTDEQIQASFVDTWGPSAWLTLFLLAVISLALVLSLVLALFFTGSDRRLSAIAVAAAVLSDVLVLSAHVSLTERVTRLTGQTFGAFYGLL